MQVAGHRAGRADDHVAGVGDVVDHPDHLRLRRQRGVPEGVRALHRPVPLLRQPRDLVAVLLAHAPGPQARGQRLDADARVADQRYAGVLGGVETGHVEVHEAHLGMSEGGA